MQFNNSQELLYEYETAKEALRIAKQKLKEEKQSFIKRMVKQGMIEVHHPYKDLGWGDEHEEKHWLIHQDYPQAATYVAESRYNHPDDNYPEGGVPIPEDKYYDLT